MASTNPGDVVDESSLGSGGTDLVAATISVNLGDTVHFRGVIENLALLGGDNLNGIGQWRG